jgi:hypothetical protein
MKVHSDIKVQSHFSIIHIFSRYFVSYILLTYFISMKFLFFPLVEAEGFFFVHRSMLQINENRQDPIHFPKFLLAVKKFLTLFVAKGARNVFQIWDVLQEHLMIWLWLFLDSAISTNFK